MITGPGVYNGGSGVSPFTYYGLSTDTTKPTAGIGNGSCFIEMDTSKIYFFDEENAEWLEWGASNE